jgi:hypothetical protein
MSATEWVDFVVRRLVNYLGVRPQWIEILLNIAQCYKIFWDISEMNDLGSLSLLPQKTHTLSPERRPFTTASTTTSLNFHHRTFIYNTVIHMLVLIIRVST